MTSSVATFPVREGCRRRTEAEERVDKKKVGDVQAVYFLFL
jgi:hypothetical protein